MARPKNLVTYFGGYASAIRGGDKHVHIFRDDDSETFCGLTDNVAMGTPRTVGQPHREWCEVCLQDAQDARRDIPAGSMEVAT